MEWIDISDTSGLIKPKGDDWLYCLIVTKDSKDERSPYISTYVTFDMDYKDGEGPHKFVFIDDCSISHFAADVIKYMIIEP